MYRFLRMLLFLLPAETAHHGVLRCLEWLGHFTSLCRRWRARVLRQWEGQPLDVAGLSFAHPLGLAAGLDKDARAVAAFYGLGFSFVEVGTLTPRPQPGNPRPRLFRLPAHRALINRMGFNNEGAVAAARRLAATSFRPGPVGANLGKNKDTPLEQAPEDYARATEALAPVADYLVVNLSSPNTPGLRTLQAPEQLRAILSAVMQTLSRLGLQRPVFLKIAPDLTPEAVDAAVDVALELAIAGMIATNTTVLRPLENPPPLAQEAGGLSGAPLEALATQTLRRAYARAQGRLPLIGVGGVFSAEDVYRKLRAGACLVQLYTGFVYEGPSLVPKLLKEVRALAVKDGFKDWREVIGSDTPWRWRTTAIRL